MPGNRFGHALQLTTFGESHGAALGAVIDGLPAGLPVDVAALQGALGRRRPGRLPGGTGRQEPDEVEILSGVFQGQTLGSPVAVIVRNVDARPEDYEALKTVHRPGHGDRSTELKYGRRDHRGGGRSSGRETLARVIGGYFAGLLLPQDCRVTAWIEELGPFQSVAGAELGVYGLRGVDDAQVEAWLLALKAQGESVGAQLCCRIHGCPPGLGEPVFDKLKADLAKGIMSIGAVTGFGYGMGADFGSSFGQAVTADTAHFGGIEGGISTGDPIHLNLTVRPPSTVGEKAKAGRHDPCIAPRVLPVVEAMVTLVLADHYLRQCALDRGHAEGLDSKL
ncbi:MAG: chorismate synthase [Myxococcales bacterium]|nr:chorismate synthase [Myxococcales bacterium]